MIKTGLRDWFMLIICCANLGNKLAAAQDQNLEIGSHPKSKKTMGFYKKAIFKYDSHKIQIMKKFLFLILLFTTFSGQSFEQILTKEQNNSWIAALEQEDLSKQLKMIRTRWDQDAEFHYEVAASPHKIITDNRATPQCRPLYLINHKEEGQIIFPANPSPGKIAGVSKLISPDNVYDVKVASESTQLLYGQRGSCGVIYISVADKATFNRITSELRP